ncbi:uncharacterized protein LOC127080295 [Lathyrus oleraceus]|uniref:uncharacterized protein LOC127080295 n=1 Tax=Pisum sativum TaxID=3888 RepID=UPI0021D0C814|nr:uncharacterized protein LOC127080295 [Pisum sativum]
MGQIAQQIAGSRTQGSLPSETLQNPRNHDNVNVVTPRSEKIAKDEEVIPPIKPVEEKNKKEPKLVIKLPYPQRVTKKEPRETDFEKFIIMFKKIESHMPFFEALEQMPMYTKFMKEVITKKRPIGDGSVALNEKCSAISPGRRIPSKQKDPGAITVPCTIKDRTFKKVLINSRASVSLMSLEIYQRLGIGNVSNTRTNLKFADHFIKNAYGMAEDILMTIEELSFPVGFVIIDIPEDEETPIIFGRPFIEDRKLEVEKENHYQVGMIRTDVKSQSNIPTSEKDSRRPSQLLPPPLATPSEKIPVPSPKSTIKRVKPYHQGQGTSLLGDIQSLNTGREKEIHAMEEESIQRMLP